MMQLIDLKEINNWLAIHELSVCTTFRMVFSEAFLSDLQVLLLIDIQVSYINTNHEDFIGFAKYVKHLIATCLPPAALSRVHVVSFHYHPTTL